MIKAEGATARGVKDFLIKAKPAPHALSPHRHVLCTLHIRNIKCQNSLQRSIYRTKLKA